MLPGSLYYHFARKEDLLAAVYAEGRAPDLRARRGGDRRQADPWDRLEAACVAHLEALLEESDYAQVVIRVRPDDVPAVAAQLVELRDAYERLFVDLVAGLPARPGLDRRSLRLLLLGALNWSQTWYRPGSDDPRAIARRFVALLREPRDDRSSPWTCGPKCSSPRSASTATTAAAAWSPRTCATPGWR